jgi:EAL domain-containing protein (putative c-di-GMP-specific phosphodiesterase class I)/DNA-binding NarL/FixJ family response regulator
MRRREPLVRVLVAEDDPTMRSALCALVEADPALELVGAAGDADAAIAVAEVERPDVCIVDVSMPAGGGARATREIRRAVPDARVLVHSGSEDRTTVLDLLRAGASGYVVKGTAPDEVLEALRRTARGESTLSHAVADSVVGALTEVLVRDEAASDLRAATIDRIRRTIDGGLLTTVLQPICELDTRAPAGFEALSRFAVEPVQAPDVWFGEAEEVGLLLELDLAAVRSALRTLPALAPAAFLALNVSPSTVTAPAFLDAVLGCHDASRVVIEITEHAPIERYETVGCALARLRADGVRVAIDDAGAGFASLRHILRLEPDFIKLDGELTRNVAVDRSQRALASALISFARETGATIIAEGLETDEQIAVLRDLGVSVGQGYRLGRPAPPAAAAASASGSAARTAPRGRAVAAGARSA